MDDLRKLALELAANSLQGAPFTEIVRAAEAFHAFLRGDKDTATPEAVSYDLGKADQTPEDLQSVLDRIRKIGTAPETELPPAEAFGRVQNTLACDDTPTRLVKRPTEYQGA